MSWTTVTRPGCSRWGIASSMTTTVDHGVDFVYRVRASYPLRLCDDRPIIIRNVLSEGQP